MVVTRNSYFYFPKIGQNRPPKYGTRHKVEGGNTWDHVLKVHEKIYGQKQMEKYGMINWLRS